MADKQLIIVVEGTSALGPYWNTIVSDYLEKIIRSFCGNNMTIQKSSASAASDSTFELALVVFNTHGPYSAYLVRRSGWTRDVDNFFGWLSNLSFSGGGWDDVATTEGLAEALMMFAIPQNGYQAQQNVEGRRHCVLVSASNPYTLPTPVYRPKIKKLEPAENGEKQKNNYLYDAETVSKWFGQCCVSLSVICPKQLPKLRAIYNAAKCSQKTSEPAIDVKQPHFLVLLSDSFVEACAALSRSDMPQSQKPVSTLPPGSGLSVSSPLANGTTLNRPPISTGNVPQHPIKEEPVNSIGSQPAHPHMPSMPHRAAPTVSSSQASSPPVSQDIITNNDGVPEIKPIVSMPQSLQANGTVLNITSGVQSATGSTLPTPGMPQQPQGMQSVGMNGSVSNMPPSQQGSTSLSASQSKYIKVWEGNLSGLKQGQPVFITKLEGYRNATASATIAADWPPIMQLARLISQDYMNNKQYVGKADFLVFRAMNQHGFLSQLQEKKLCAVIQLPSQTLLLSVSDKACRLIGMLFPGDMVVFKPQIPGQVSLHQLQQHQQQNQQMQQHPQSQEQQIQHMQQQQTMQQLPQQQFLQLQQQQQSQSQQMVGGGTSQGYLQGSVRPQLVPEGQVPSQGTSPNMAGGGFMG